MLLNYYKSKGDVKAVRFKYVDSSIFSGSDMYSWLYWIQFLLCTVNCCGWMSLPKTNAWPTSQSPQSAHKASLLSHRVLHAIVVAVGCCDSEFQGIFRRYSGISTLHPGEFPWGGSHLAWQRFAFTMNKSTFSSNTQPIAFIHYL